MSADGTQIYNDRMLFELQQDKAEAIGRATEPMPDELSESILETLHGDVRKIHEWQVNIDKELDNLNTEVRMMGEGKPAKKEKVWNRATGQFDDASPVEQTCPPLVWKHDAERRDFRAISANNPELELEYIIERNGSGWEIVYNGCLNEYSGNLIDLDPEELKDICQDLENKAYAENMKEAKESNV